MNIKSKLNENKKNKNKKGTININITKDQAFQHKNELKY